MRGGGERGNSWACRPPPPLPTRERHTATTQRAGCTCLGRRLSATLIGSRLRYGRSWRGSRTTTYCGFFFFLHPCPHLRLAASPAAHIPTCAPAWQRLGSGGGGGGGRDDGGLFTWEVDGSTAAARVVLGRDRVSCGGAGDDGTNGDGDGDDGVHHFFAFDDNTASETLAAAGLPDHRDGSDGGRSGSGDNDTGTVTDGGNGGVGGGDGDGSGGYGDGDDDGYGRLRQRRRGSTTTTTGQALLRYWGGRVPRRWRPRRFSGGGGGQGGGGGKRFLGGVAERRRRRLGSGRQGW